MFGLNDNFTIIGHYTSGAALVNSKLIDKSIQPYLTPIVIYNISCQYIGNALGATFGKAQACL